MLTQFFDEDQFHPPQAVLLHPQGGTLDDAIKVCGERIYYVHLKNSCSVRGAPGRIPTGLGDGEINTRHLLRLLRASGYEGPLCLEGPRPGDREWFAQADIAYLKRLLADLGM